MTYLTNVVSIILTAFLSSWLTYFFGIRHLRTETELRLKAEKYSNLIKYIRGFIGKSADRELKEKFFSEWETSWLYCSDDVYQAINKMLNYARSLSSEVQKEDKEEGKKLLGNIIIKMRSDLFGKKTKLSSADFLFWEVLS